MLMCHKQKRGLARLLIRWPDRRDQLVRAARSQTMMDICESYELAWSAALHWAKAPGSKAAEIATEYRLLIIEIEQEVLHLTARIDRDTGSQIPGDRDQSPQW